MNLLPSKLVPGARRLLVVSVLAIMLGSRVAAQSAPEERWLLIFDTSATMKKWQPGVESEIKNLLASAVSEQLHKGDSLGVWTFGKELHTGQFPLLMWDPAQAAVTASNLVTFVRKQSYTGDTSWATLQPQLDQVIKNSERLTIIVFCDGQGAVNWTPYNDGINQTFSQGLAERKQTRQPFVLLVRTQRGQFTGCTVNFPPGALNVPPFPPLPEPPKPVPTNLPPPVVVKPPPAVAPSLFIVGTNAATNVNDLPKISAPVTNLLVAPITPTNGSSASNHTASAVASNPPSIAPTAKPAEVPTNQLSANPAAGSPTNSPPVVATSELDDHSPRTLIYVGLGLFAAAIGLMLFLWARSARQPHGSLITSSMQNDPRLPPRK